MPAFLVALMVVVLVVLGLTAVLLLTRTMRKEAAAVPLARPEERDDVAASHTPTGSGHPDSEPSGPHPPRTEDD
ncbi:hypothetical protein G7072_00080 [Nocardioides sp. HDW12B]|uniref:hypothetical protein n=1 Tax=Nocardioides sp. HDW12B TaxID=2714939 RepID=UPI00140B3709|nr:hypothetical protein [Nocardioides sp. HDW12B]QIK64941.1 hypothetical protein G7072_00080 [Nocardioides sp. HDW12B]